MSQSQFEAYAVLNAAGAIVSSNEAVLAKIKSMPGQKGTYKEIIAFITGDSLVSTVEGNARAAPIIRALSELGDEGVLDISESVINPETGKPNTVYRWLGKNVPAPVKEETWKQYAQRLEKEMAELKTKYEVCCATVERQEVQISALTYELNKSIWRA